MKQVRRDFSAIVSAVLLVVLFGAVVTGVIADVWDLHDFIFHRWAGYTLAVVALIHVLLHWNRLVRYIGRRLTRSRSRRGRESNVATTESNTGGTTSSRRKQEQSTSLSRFSRRGFIGLVLGAVGGFFAGRGLRPVELPYGSDIGEIYHEWSKPGLMSLLGTLTSWGDQPEFFKVYPDAVRVALPSPGEYRGLLTEETIDTRRSLRNYTGVPLTIEEFSRLLYYTAGANADRWGTLLRAAPSAGAQYPIEMYIVVHDVEGVEPGLYHYAVREHAVDRLREGDLRGQIVRDGLMQEFLGEANVVIVFTAIFQRLRWRYKERTYRYAMLEAGHLGQNVYLAATAMGLGACAVGAFLDDNLNSMLEIDGRNEAVLYFLSVGNV